MAASATFAIFAVSFLVVALIAGSYQLGVSTGSTRKRDLKKARTALRIARSGLLGVEGQARENRDGLLLASDIIRILDTTRTELDELTL